MCNLDEHCILSIIRSGVQKSTCGNGGPLKLILTYVILKSFLGKASHIKSNLNVYIKHVCLGGFGPDSKDNFIADVQVRLFTNFDVNHCVFKLVMSTRVLQ